MIAAFFKLLRPKQWTKNLIVFVGVVFSGRALNIEDGVQAIIAFILFCMLSGSVYVLNDLLDAEKDRQHPSKKDRPIAAGKISRGAAAAFFLILTSVALGLSFWALNWKFGVCASVYLAFNILYNLGLKNLVIVDCVIIALGYVIRAVAGIYAILVQPGHLSEWLLICTFFLALFLAFSKRRGEITDLNESGVAYRPILASYSAKLIDEMIAVATASAVMSYSLYTIWPGTVARLGTSNMIYTIPFVVYGILRYLYLIHKKGKGAHPTSIFLTDRPFQANLLLYVAAVFIILYVIK